MGLPFPILPAQPEPGADGQGRGPGHGAPSRVQGQHKAPLQRARGIQTLEPLGQHGQALIPALEAPEGRRGQAALGLPHPGQVCLPGHERSESVV